MDTQEEGKNRIASIKNVHKITRAMEMVAAARLRRAEQRIEGLRPYSARVREMSRGASAPVPRAAAQDAPSGLGGRRQDLEPAAARGSREPQERRGAAGHRRPRA